MQPQAPEVLFSAPTGGEGASAGIQSILLSSGPLTLPPGQGDAAAGEAQGGIGSVLIEMTH